MEDVGPVKDVAPSLAHSGKVKCAAGRKSRPLTTTTTTRIETTATMKRGHSTARPTVLANQAFGVSRPFCTFVLPVPINGRVPTADAHYKDCSAMTPHDGSILQVRILPASYLRRRPGKSQGLGITEDGVMTFNRPPSLFLINHWKSLLTKRGHRILKILGPRSLPGRRRTSS